MTGQGTGGAPMKGLLHCHSVYSDGEYTLPELRAKFVGEGLAFACVTDHADFFDDESLRAYVDECEALSDESFRFVAGLEYGCEQRMHVLGYGVTSLVTTTDPQAVIRHIDAAGGVSVIAHPADSMFAWIETFDTLPLGIEVWNSKYDGRAAPRPGTFGLLARLQQRSPAMRAFYGVDLHWRHQYHGLVTVLSPGTPTRAGILAALRRGDFTGLAGELALPASGALPEATMSRFQDVNARYQRRQRLVKRIKRLLGGVGRRLPPSVKAQLRRILS
jgi:hypothetical protein